MPNDVIKDSTSGIALDRDGVGQEPPEATWYDVEAAWLMMYHAAWLSDTQGGTPATPRSAVPGTIPGG
jgi:hypothetical protein